MCVAPIALLVGGVIAMAEGPSSDGSIQQSTVGSVVFPIAVIVALVAFIYGALRLARGVVGKTSNNDQGTGKLND
jgi:hypothetical protein